MLVSVAIPAYNQADYLRLAIESALAQTYRPLEIIVVDDGSEDHTREVCLSYNGQVKYIYQHNDGTYGGGARNRAIREAQGEWVALLDQDDLWAPTKIEKQVEVVKNRTDVGAVFTQTKCIDESGKELNYEATRGKPGQIFHTLLRGNPFYPSAGMFRKDVLNICGYPDADTLSDWDLWLRIARYCEVYVIDEHLSLYRVHKGGFSSNISRMADKAFLLLARQQIRLHDGCVECRESVSFAEKVYLKLRAEHHLRLFHVSIVSRDNKTACYHLAEVFKSDPTILFQDKNLFAMIRNLVSIPVRPFVKR